MANRPLAYKPLKKMSKYPALSEDVPSLMENDIYDTKLGGYVTRAPIDYHPLTAKEQVAEARRQLMNNLDSSVKAWRPPGRTVKHPEGVKKGGTIRGCGCETKGRTRGTHR